MSLLRGDIATAIVRGRGLVLEWADPTFLAHLPPGAVGVPLPEAFPRHAELHRIMRRVLASGCAAVV